MYSTIGTDRVAIVGDNTIAFFEIFDILSGLYDHTDDFVARNKLVRIAPSLVRYLMVTRYSPETLR